MAAGFPLVAAFQPAVFYAPSLLFYLFPFFDAVRLTFLAHFLIAASGAYYLCRLWKYPIHLCMIGAILFALGGTTVSLSNLLNHFQSAVWLPWMVLCWERFLNTSSWKTFVALVLVLVSALLAGSPEIYIFSLALLLLDGIRVSWDHPERSVARAILSLVAANLFVALLGMIQLLPTIELLLQSRRDGSISFQEASLWSLQPASLLGLFFPDKEVDISLPLGVRLFFARDIPFFLSHYLGVLSFLGHVGVGLVRVAQGTPADYFLDFDFVALGARQLDSGLSVPLRPERLFSRHTVSGKIRLSHLCVALICDSERFGCAASTENFRAKFPGLRSVRPLSRMGNSLSVLPLVS